ncbi:hypothetical protein M378DRAFT_14362 [Amanita muscaria Koide BX008]|uniref:Uncharacterized protein n=1 Tax=Amanita muscaria (strain Koide BX008) TaxID=946122 RepID=A0A0C2SB88_AMAMK|nr:hypothetical protein M378DRAFT_14362 [Amanita muscaria Koide BX008]
MSNYSTTSENSVLDASSAPLPVPIPSPNEAYVLVPATWGGPAWTNDDPSAPITDWEEGCTTRWDTPTPESWSPVIPPEPLVAPLSTPISPAPLPSPLLLPAPPPTQASPSPAPSPIPQYVEALANQILEAMENGSDKENVPPRPVTPHPNAPHMLQSEFVLVYDHLRLLPTLRVKVHRVLGILLDPRAASRILYEVIDRESAVLMDLLETFDNIAYTPPMGDEVSRYRINLMVDLALRLLQNGIELILYESLRKIDWEQVLLRTAEELNECLASQTNILQHCSKLQIKLERETRALSAIVPLTFKELPKLEWSEECYLDDVVQRLGGNIHNNIR